MENDFQQFISRLSAIEYDVYRFRLELTQFARERLEPRQDAAKPAAPPPDTAKPSPRPMVSPPAPAVCGPDIVPKAPAREAVQWEALLAGQALHIAGLVLIVLAASFFLKVAFDNNWIGPATRVALGLISGAAVMIFADRVRNRGQRYFAEGLIALGAGIEYVSLYAAGNMFHLFAPSIVFFGMVAVTAALGALAYRYRSERLAFLGGIGGFITPLLVGGPSDDRFILAAYLAVINVGLLVLGQLLGSSRLQIAALFGTVVYWFADFGFVNVLSDVQKAEIGGVFYAVFATASLIVARVRPKLDPIHLLLSAANVAWLVYILESTLPASQRMVLAASLLAVSAIHLSAAVWLRSRFQSWLAIATLSFAIPAAFHVEGTNVAWAVEAAILFIAGLRYSDSMLRKGSAVLFAIDALRMLALYPPYHASTYLINERFVSLSVLAITVLIVCRYMRQDAPLLSDIEQRCTAICRIAGHALLLWAFSADAWDWASTFPGRLSAFGELQAAQVAISLVWTGFAGILVARGLQLRDEVLRWEGLALLVTTVAKVLAIDLATLEVAYRVVSSLVLGVVLTAISYVYQRSFPRAADEPQ